MSLCNNYKGQKIEIDKKGRMGRVIGSSNSQEPTFKVVNKFGPAKVGVNCRVNGGWKRCYVSPVKSRNGDEVSVAPLPKIMIWFQRDVKTGMKIKDTISNGLEVDFTAGKSSYVARYGATGSTYGEKGVGSEGGSGVWSLVSNMDPDDSQ